MPEAEPGQLNPAMAAMFAKPVKKPKQSTASKLKAAFELVAPGALMETTFTAPGPLGMVIQRRVREEDSGSYLIVDKITEGRQASSFPEIQPGLLLMKVNGVDVSTQALCQLLVIPCIYTNAFRRLMGRF